MLTRRHIRIKVMQSLYSFLSSKNSQIQVVKKEMLKHFDKVVELKLVIISLIIEIVRYADDFYEEGKKKHLPSFNDLNPNKRFINNSVVVSLRSNNSLMDKVSKVSAIWLKNDHDIIRKIFNSIIKTDLYVNYLESKDLSIESEKRFIIDLMNDYILNNKLLHHIFEEMSIYWIDDLPFVASVLFGDIKEDIDVMPKGTFKQKSDKEFAIKLFRNTINHNLDYEEIIQRFSNNWELDRIAKMDQLFLKMAFSEILSMPNLPIKVSLNEYIEIAKYYGTSKSRLFINGLLDNFIKTYKKEGKITKTGRGLVE
ncbi:MAG: antitermination protein NusB [Flavobacteriales bacterium]|nr:antitermination protein NusB [Flavobacteriales bacterium]